MSPSPRLGPPSGSSNRGHKGVEQRRARGVGLAISLVLHLVVIAVAIRTVVIPAAEGDADPADPSPAVAEQIEFFDLTQLPDIALLPFAAVEPEEELAAEPRPPPPRAEEEPRPAAEALGEEPLTVPTGVVGGRLPSILGPFPKTGGGLSLAERLRPRMGDPRLWVGMERSFSDLTDFERADLLLRGMIQSWNDSVAVADALANRGRDWTYTDASGKRWGLASGRLYLGDFSIPIPLSFGVPPGQRQAWAERQWIAQDIAQGAATAQIRQTWADRARAIRERLEAERDAVAGAKTDAGGGG
ncbi:MAG: hypothetical protein EXR92_07470 [Gemmatimonadetes bacterium]|nr:hypothetical protein [Gemmatimonadota bacterium]